MGEHVVQSASFPCLLLVQLELFQSALKSQLYFIAWSVLCCGELIAFSLLPGRGTAILIICVSLSLNHTK